MSIDQCRLVQLSRVDDPRGALTFIEGESGVPFAIQRVYYVTSVPVGAERGAHAHRVCEHFVIAASGSFEVELDDGRQQRTYLLDSPHIGLYLPRMIWRTVRAYSAHAVCLVLASEHYLEEDYIREHADFKHLARSK